MNNRPVLKIVGVIFAMAGLYFMIQSISDYMESCNQQEWQLETATVMNVKQRIETNGVKIRTRKTVYDIDYEYTVDEKVYSGNLYGTVGDSKQIGSTFEIRYNPQSPDEHTAILSPSIPHLVMGIISSCLFIFVSLVMTGVITLTRLSNLFRRKKNRFKSI